MNAALQHVAIAAVTVLLVASMATVAGYRADAAQTANDGAGVSIEKSWEVKLPKFAEDLAIADGRIIIDLNNGQVEVRAAQDGALLWQAAWPGAFLSIGAADDGLLYLLADNASVGVWTSSSGSLVHVEQLGGEPTSLATFNGEAFVGARDGTLTAFTTAHRIWNLDLGDAIESLVANEAGIIVATESGVLHSIGLDGKHDWTTPTNAGRPRSAVAELNGTVVLVSRGAIQAFEAETGRLRWMRNNTMGSDNIGPPVLWNDLALIHEGQGILHAYNLSDGTLAWMRDAIATDPGGPEASVPPPALPPAISQGRIVHAASNGSLMWLDSEGAVLGQVGLPAGARAGVVVESDVAYVVDSWPKLLAFKPVVEPEPGSPTTLAASTSRDTPTSSAADPSPSEPRPSPTPGLLVLIAALGALARVRKQDRG